MKHSREAACHLQQCLPLSRRSFSVSGFDIRWEEVLGDEAEADHVTKGWGNLEDINSMLFNPFPERLL
jgi:hypothetical protein